MEYIWIIIIITILFLLELGRNAYYKNLLEEEVQSMGGVLLSCRREWGFFMDTPYIIRGSWNVIYFFEYRVDNEDKEGWVKFGIFLGPDWRL